MESNGHDLRGLNRRGRVFAGTTIIGPQALSITKRRARGTTPLSGRVQPQILQSYYLTPNKLQTTSENRIFLLKPEIISIAAFQYSWCRNVDNR